MKVDTKKIANEMTDYMSFVLDVDRELYATSSELNQTRIFVDVEFQGVLVNLGCKFLDLIGVPQDTISEMENDQEFCRDWLTDAWYEVLRGERDWNNQEYFDWVVGEFKGALAVEGEKLL